MSCFLSEFIYHTKPQFQSDFKALQAISLKAHFFLRYPPNYLKSPVTDRKSVSE